MANEIVSADLLTEILGDRTVPHFKGDRLHGEKGAIAWPNCPKGLLLFSNSARTRDMQLEVAV